MKKKANTFESVMEFARTYLVQISSVSLLREHTREDRWRLYVEGEDGKCNWWYQHNGGASPPKWMTDAVVELRKLAVEKGWTEYEDGSCGRVRSWIYKAEKQERLFG